MSKHNDRPLRSSDHFSKKKHVLLFVVCGLSLSTLFLFQNCTSGLGTDLNKVSPANSTSSQDSSTSGSGSASNGDTTNTGGSNTPSANSGGVTTSGSTTTSGGSSSAQACATSTGVASNFSCSTYFNVAVDGITLTQAQKNYSDHLINGLLSRGGWGNGNVFQIDFSIDVLNFDASSNRYFNVDPVGDWSPEGDVLTRIPAPPLGSGNGFEGANTTCSDDGDCHYIALDKTNKKLYEVYRAAASGNTLTTPGYGGLFVWDFNTIYPQKLRGDTCTSADAGGLSIGAMMFSADEIKAGAINHAIRFILPNNRIANRTYVRPSSHTTGDGKTWAPAPTTDLTEAPLANPSLEPGLPYGTRLRLKAGYDISKLSSSAQVVAKALKKYGMILADGGNILVTAQSDQYTTAKYADLGFDARSLSVLKPGDFEVVPPEKPVVDLTFTNRATVIGNMIKVQYLDCERVP